MPKNRTGLVFAYDKPTFTAVDAHMLGRIHRHVDALKIGMIPMFSGWAEGPSIGNQVYKIWRSFGKPVVLDLKPWDIRDTVKEAIQALLEPEGVMGATVPAADGMATLEAVTEIAGKLGKMIYVVTVPTNMDDRDSTSCFGAKRSDVVLRFAKMAVNARATGIVCSGLDLDNLRTANLIGDGALEETFIPSIRPAGSAAGDQKNIITPEQAAAMHVTWAVVGRPIYEAPDPVESARLISETLSQRDGRLTCGRLAREPGPRVWGRVSFFYESV